MTLDELRSTLGIPADLEACHARLTESHRALAWNGPVDGRSGWWWAVMPLDSDEVIAAGWAAGRTRDRDGDIRAALVRILARREQSAQELAS